MSDNSIRGFRKNNGEVVLQSSPDSGLERLCSVRRDGIWSAKPEAGVERIEAVFRGQGFSPHRHDTYAIGLTMRGVQRFMYRGEERASLAGQVIVLHPDEMHDGGAGTETGLHYRMIYVPPEHISEALQDTANGRLPFVREAILADHRFRKCLIEALLDMDQDMGPLKRAGVISDLAHCLELFSDSRTGRSQALHWPAIRQCAAYLRENTTASVDVADLETLSGLDRFSLARQFRAAFGTSPHRYLVMRRLEAVKAALAAGETLAGTAITCGFSDQSHMTRHFKRAFGMPPGKWQRLGAAGATSHNHG
ncbi:AraC family transcriptional regulator [Roseibium sp. RKSG952]|uniref:AraC family transcriptional regulator n=1 Tax=Roseibium sp. RKSG952 TaxID=2529384 RepID=UPI0012BB5809|nr:AraC family transcriptional regulator [Roseibium sp. RKSG952]MTH97735.1 AraC family transcriptional regulator [Roseibium sp. RKSG952]